MDISSVVVDACAVAALRAHALVTCTAPKMGWGPFFGNLVLKFNGPRKGLPRSQDDPGQSSDERHVLAGKFPKHGYGMRVVHTTSGVEWIMSHHLSTGGYGAVWAMHSATAAEHHDLPTWLVLKVFRDVDSQEAVREVANIDLMNTVDAKCDGPRKRARVEHAARVPAAALQDACDSFCVVMPRLAGPLPHKAAMKPDAAYAVLRAVLSCVLEVRQSYDLLCMDLKTANVLVDVSDAHVRVTLADYGGFTMEGRVVRVTYPVPWSRRPDMCAVRATEEAAVYSFFPLFLSLVGSDTDAADQPFAHKSVSLDKTGVEVASAAVRALQKPWPPRVLEMLCYCVRARPPTVDVHTPGVSACFDKSLPKRTLAGLCGIMTHE